MSRMNTLLVEIMTLLDESGFCNNTKILETAFFLQSNSLSKSERLSFHLTLSK